MLHVTPSSYRVYLSPCEVQVLRGPLELGMSATDLSEVPVMSLQVTGAGFLLCHALGAQRHGGQQQASCALSA